MTDLQEMLAARRELPIALAHGMAAAKLGSERMTMLTRHFERLPFAGQFACKMELFRCREAQRQATLARVCHAHGESAAKA